MKINEYNQMMKYLTRPKESEYEQVAMAGPFIKGGKKVIDKLIKKGKVKKGEAPKTNLKKVRTRVQKDREALLELAKNEQIPVEQIDKLLSGEIAQVKRTAGRGVIKLDKDGSPYVTETFTAKINKEQIPVKDETIIPEDVITVPDPFKEKYQQEFLAHDALYGRRSGDNKVDAEAIAETVADMQGKVYDDLGYTERMDLYDKAYGYLSLLDRTKDAMKEKVGRTLNADGGFQSEKFLAANRAKAAAASEAAKKKAMEKKVDKPTSTYYGGVKGVKFKNEAQRKEYINILKEKYKSPSKSTPSKFSNQNIAKKFNITPYEVERINSVLKKELNLEYPKQTYEGEQKRQRERDVRRKERIKEVSDPKMEKRIKDVVKEVDPKILSKEVDLAHRASLKANSEIGSDYLVNSLGLDKKIVNQKLVKPTEQKLGKLYDDQKKLVKGLTPGNIPKETQKKIEKLNIKISELADRTKGALQGVLIDEKTLKPYVYGVDYKKVLGSGLVDKTVKNLSPEDLDLIKINIQNQVKAAPTKLYSGFSPELGKLSYEVLKDVVKGIPTPLGAVGLTAATGGIDPTSAIDRTALGAELAFAPELVRQSAKFGPTTQKILNLGLKAAPAMRIARLATPVGIATLGAEGAYQFYKALEKEKARIAAMSPEERQQFEEEQTASAYMGEAGNYAAGGRVEMAGGGIAALKALINFLGKGRGKKGSELLKEVNPKKYGTVIENLMLPDDKKMVGGFRVEYLESLLDTIKNDKAMLDRIKEMPVDQQESFFNMINQGANQGRLDVYKKINPDEAILEIEQMIKNLKTKDMSPEEVKRSLNALGGRVGFKKGGMNRRTFIKLMGGLASLPIVGKFIKPAAKVAPAVSETIARTSENIPVYMTQLIDKIKSIGKSKTIGKPDNPEGFVQYDLEDYTLVEGPGYTRVSKTEYGASSQGEGIKNQLEVEIKKDPETGALEYDEFTVSPDAEGKLKDVDFGIEDMDHKVMEDFANE